MNIETAYKLVGVLAAGTHGFDNESSDVYATRFSQLNNPKALARAVERIIETWDRGYRPPIAAVLEAYHKEVTRLSSETMPIGSTSRYPSFAEGVEIAWQAYQREVVLQGRDPDRARFDKMMGVLR